MTTDFFVKYGLYDTTALQDAKESSETNAVLEISGYSNQRTVRLIMPLWSTIFLRWMAACTRCRIIQQTSLFFPAYNPGQMGSLQNSL